MNYKIAVVPGDGIGPEVIDQALRVLESRIRKIPIRTVRSSFWAGIRDLSLYPVERR